MFTKYENGNMKEWNNTKEHYVIYKHLFCSTKKSKTKEMIEKTDVSLCMFSIMLYFECFFLFFTDNLGFFFLLFHFVQFPCFTCCSCFVLLLCVSCLWDFLFLPYVFIHSFIFHVFILFIVSAANKMVSCYNC